MARICERLRMLLNAVLAVRFGQLRMAIIVKLNIFVLLDYDFFIDHFEKNYVSRDMSKLKRIENIQNVTIRLSRVVLCY